MRIIHVISSLDLSSGGPVVALRGLTEAQVKRGLEVCVISTFSLPFDDTVVQQLRQLGVHVEMVGPAKGPLQGHSSLRSVVQNAIANSDVVHIHAVWEEIQHQAATIARKLKKPYIFRTCGMLDPWQLQQSKAKKALYLKWRLKKDLNGATALHFTSDEERRLVAPLGLRPEAIVEANGVRIPTLESSGSAARFKARFGIAEGERLLLFLSRIHPKKGLDLLIPAFAKASATGALPNVKLVIAGPDENGYQAQVEALIEQHDVQDRVLFTGILNGEEKWDAFVAADIFVLPSYQENFGNAVVEALAAGTPVLITDQVNIHSEISHAGVGGVVTTQADDLAQALGQWMTNEDLRQSAAAKAKKFVAENYDWDAIAARWALRYESFLERQ